jgi:hypothetical protein
VKTARFIGRGRKFGRKLITSFELCQRFFGEIRALASGHRTGGAEVAECHMLI